jgi:hypothetical protein
MNAKGRDSIMPSKTSKVKVEVEVEIPEGDDEGI